jgi:hypothetical protein
MYVIKRFRIIHHCWTVVNEETGALHGLYCKDKAKAIATQRNMVLYPRAARPHHVVQLPKGFVERLRVQQLKKQRNELWFHIENLEQKILEKL